MGRLLLALGVALFALFFLLTIQVSAKRQRQPGLFLVALCIFIPWFVLMALFIVPTLNVPTVHWFVFLGFAVALIPMGGWLLERRSWRREQQGAAQISVSEEQR